MKQFTVKEVGIDFSTLESCYLVDVGCAKLWFPSRGALSEALKQYLADQEGTEEAFHRRMDRKCLNKYPDVPTSLPTGRIYDEAAQSMGFRERNPIP